MPKIVITGGPCAGKTTVLGMLSAAFVQRGREVAIMDECATELLAQDISPTTCGSVLAFQRRVFELQLKKEAGFASLSPSTVVLLDRGIMDNGGYLSADELDMLLREHHMTREEAYARYDVVIHLVTAAIGAEKYFSHLTNEHRLEGVAEAARVDEALRKSWEGHPNLHVIDNEGTFDDKLNRAIGIVLAAVGEA